MHEAEVEPDWVSGVSIGAINSAIIAGNPPSRRLRALQTFWDRITERRIWPFTPDGDVFRKARNATSCWLTIAASPSAVGDGKDAAPYLLATPPGRLATGIRVMISGEGPASVEDVHALGPVTPLQPAPAGRSGAAG